MTSQSLPRDTIRDVEVKRCLECGARYGIDASFCSFCGVPVVTTTWDPTGDPLLGQIVDGRYEVIEAIGEGGMGTVYRVRHATLNRVFAMKVLRRDLALDGALSARFVQEARATAAIKHPSVVAITDFGVLADGIPYFVMELLAGETLAARIRACGALTPASAVKVTRAIAEALVATHAAGVIHRDLKPENVFLTGAAVGKEPEDAIRVVDFGAAKVVGASKLTRPGVVFGTPHYMSPEQASGQPIDGRADIYSLGVLLYEMLTGTVPFQADTYMGVLTKHMFAAPMPPSNRVGPGVELGPLEAIVLRAMEKEPARRFASAVELVEALDAISEGRADVPALRASPRVVPRAPLSTADRIELSVGRQVTEEARRKRRLVATALVTACTTLAIAILVVALVAPGPSREPIAAPAPPASSGAPSPAATTAPLPAATSTSPPFVAAAAEPPAAPRVAPSPAAPSPSPAPPSPAAPPVAAATETANLAPPARQSPGADRTKTSGAAKPPPPAGVATTADTAPARRSHDEFVDPWRRK